MPKGKAKKKAVRKAVRKKIVKKKAVGKKIAMKKTGGKKAVRKKAAKKRTAGKKPAKRTTAKSRSSAAPLKKAATVEPGPPPSGIPPVEEPAENQEAVATVTHYYSHLSVAVIQINKGGLNSGDTIRIKGHTTDFTQQIESMEYEHQHIEQASAGQSVGLKVKNPVREHDIVYLQK